MNAAYRGVVAGGFGLLFGNYLAWGRNLIEGSAPDWMDVLVVAVAAAVMLVVMSRLEGDAQ